MPAAVQTKSRLMKWFLVHFFQTLRFGLLPSLSFTYPAPRSHSCTHQRLLEHLLRAWWNLYGSLFSPRPGGLRRRAGLGGSTSLLSCHSSLCQGSHISCCPSGPSPSWPRCALSVSRQVAAQSRTPSSHPWQRQGSAAWSPPWNAFNSVFLLMRPRSALAVLAARSHCEVTLLARCQIKPPKSQQLSNHFFPPSPTPGIKCRPPAPALE